VDGGKTDQNLLFFEIDDVHGCSAGAMIDLVSWIITFLLSICYLWVSYNILILAVGIRKARSKDSRGRKDEDRKNLPTISIVVPVRNEEKVVGRLLEALLSLDYPKGKMDINIIEDASSDKSREICERFANRHSQYARFFHRSLSEGKPSALNFGFQHAQGDIVAVFDADNVPERDVLLRVAKYFGDSSVAAVQGTTCTINADENMLTKFISYEEAVWRKSYLHGKDALGLFVPLTGSCLFVRRSVAEKVGGWDEDCLAEDLEMSAKITENGYSIRYAPEVVSWQEAPSSFAQLFRQRVRWFRGYIEVAAKYGRFLKRPEKRAVDAEIMMMGPYVLALFFAGYLTCACSSLLHIQLDPVFAAMSSITLLVTAVTLLVVGIALVYSTRPRTAKNILWLPFVYGYLSLQGTIASYALLQTVFMRPRKWERTVKKGTRTERA